MLGAVHTTGVPCAVANVENAAENARNAEDKDLPLNVIIEIPRVKLPVAAFGAARHTSPVAVPRRRSGASLASQVSRTGRAP